MNKRQAKKQFKKKYGCTPDEYVKTLQAALEVFSDDNLEKIAENVSRTIDQLAVAVNKVCDDVSAFLQSEEFRKIMEAASDALVQSEQIQEHENDC
jgi:hypothetical protein